MNKSLTASILIASLVSSLTYSQDRINKLSNKKVDIKDDKIKLQNPIEISAGYISTKITEADNAKTNGKGATIKVGKNFNLSTEVNTATSLNLNYILLKSDQVDDGKNVKNNLTELGLSQRLSYDLIYTGTIFRPFVEAGIYRGLQQAKISSSSKYEEVKVEARYYKYSGTIGFQLILDNIVPFISYDFSKIKLDENVHFEGKVNGKSYSQNFKIRNQEDRKSKSNTLTLGVGFLF